MLKFQVALSVILDKSSLFANFQKLWFWAKMAIIVPQLHAFQKKIFSTYGRTYEQGDLIEPVALAGSISMD